ASTAHERTWPERLQASSHPGDEHVAGIGTLGKRGQLEALGKLGGQVLQAVHGEIDRPGRAPFLDLADEEPFAAAVGQPAHQAITFRPHRHQLDVGAGAVKVIRHRPSLGEREGARPRPEPHHPCRPSPNSSWTSSVHERPWPARDDSRSLVIGVWRILFTIAEESASIASFVSGAASPRRAIVFFTSPSRLDSRLSPRATMVGTTW